MSHKTNITSLSFKFPGLCEQLAQLKVISPLSSVDELSSIRHKYQAAFSHLISSTLHQINKVILKH